jgi:Cd2+/Zn2+-exporting ATPase
MIVQSGSLVVRVTRSYSDSSISRILHLVENAVQKKAQTEKFITTFARYYTPAVVAAAAGVALLPPLLLPGATFQQWIYRALVILVISCPCALVISIPLGYFGGIGGAARRGILIKGSSYIDVLTRVGTVVFDKTGTLTRGVFRVSAVNALNGYSEDEILELAAVSESHSNHPIAEAIRSAYGRPIDPAAVSSYQEIAGQGISATVHGREIYVGNNRLLHQENIEHDVCDLELTVAHVVIDGSYAGYIVISDEEKPDAAQAVAELKRLGVGETVMLTGDVEQVARYTGRRLGIDTVYAGLLPEDKVRVLDEIGGQGVRGDRDGRGRNGRGKHGRGRGRSVSDGRFRNGRGKNSRVAFAGDGINDAPVIARADVGIAMGGYGSDAAIETADVVLMTDAPSKVPEAIRLSRRTRRIVMQNIAFALGVKLVFVALGAMGVASMWEAVFADMGVTLLAVFNALRVIR